MREDIYRVLGLRVREERRTAGYTLEQLGERAGISGAFVAHIEAGRKRATLDTVSKLARALGVTAAQLLHVNDPARGADTEGLREIARSLRGRSPRQRRALLTLLRAGVELAKTR